MYSAVTLNKKRDCILLFCPVCRFKVHRRCAVRAKNNCKWTTFYSLKREDINFDESDPVSWHFNADVSCKAKSAKTGIFRVLQANCGQRGGR